MNSYIFKTTRSWCEKGTIFYKNQRKYQQVVVVRIFSPDKSKELWEVQCIKSNGKEKRDLFPGLSGNIHYDESTKEAAIREITEELGKDFAHQLVLRGTDLPREKEVLIDYWSNFYLILRETTTVMPKSLYKDFYKTVESDGTQLIFKWKDPIDWMNFNTKRCHNQSSTKLENNKNRTE